MAETEQDEAKSIEDRGPVTGDRRPVTPDFAQYSLTPVPTVKSLG